MNDTILSTASQETIPNVNSHPIPLYSIAEAHFSLQFVLAVECVFVIYVLIAFLYQIKQSNLYRTMNKRLLQFSLFGLLFYVISSILFLIAEVLRDSYDWEGWPYPFVLLLWGMANTCAYLLYIERLHTTFKDTKYASPKWIYAFFTCLLIFFISSQIIECVIITPNIYKTLSVEFTQTILIALYSWDQLIDLIMSTLLLILFIKKLFLVTLSSVDHDIAVKKYSLINCNQKHKFSVILNDHQTKLLNLVTKQCILSAFGIISTQVYISWNAFSGIIYSNIIVTLSYDDNYGLYVLCVLLFVNDCVMNVIAIYLNFKFANSWYSKLCNGCNKCCGLCCIHLAKRKIKKVAAYQQKETQQKNLLNNESTKYELLLDSDNNHL